MLTTATGCLSDFYLRDRCQQISVTDSDVPSLDVDRPAPFELAQRAANHLSSRTCRRGHVRLGKSVQIFHRAPLQHKLRNVLDAMEEREVLDELSEVANPASKETD